MRRAAGFLVILFLAAGCSQTPQAIEQVRRNVEEIGVDYARYVEADETLSQSAKAVRVGLLADTVQLLDRLLEGVETE